MNPGEAVCGELAVTGPGSSTAVMIVATLIGLGVLLIVLSTHRRRTYLVVALLVLVGLCSLSVVDQVPGARAASTCVNPALSLIITPIITITGLVPNSAPQRITGTITNTSSESIDLGTVTASIGSVTVTQLAVRGRCDSSDYVLLDPVMPINVTVAPGASASFAGAKIGFRNKAGINQDVCKGATLQMMYRLGPSE